MTNETRKAYEADDCGAVDHEEFQNAICNNMSPAGVAMAASYLQLSNSFQPKTHEGEMARNQVQWLMNTLIELLGIDEYNRLLDEIGL